MFGGLGVSPNLRLSFCNKREEAMEKNRFVFLWVVGSVGYAQWQVADDRGDDVTWDKDEHDLVFAVG